MIPFTVPEDVGLLSGAFEFRVGCVVVDIGFVKSTASSTLARLTVSLDNPTTVFEIVGLFSSAFKSRAICVAVDIGFAKPLVSPNSC